MYSRGKKGQGDEEKEHLNSYYVKTTMLIWCPKGKLCCSLKV